MIKINLASKKRAAFVAESGTKMDPLKSFKVDLDELKEFPILSIGGLILTWILGQMALGFFQDIKIKELDSELEQIMSAQQQLQAESSKSQGFDKIKAQLEADELKIRSKLDTIRSLVAGRKEATKTLILLSEALPEEVWLNKFEISQERVTLVGKASNYNQVSDFMRRLGESSLFIDLKLENTEQVLDPLGIELAQFQLQAKRAPSNE